MVKRTVLLLAVTIAAFAADAQTRFVYDTFTGPNGTLLESHTPDTGGAWTRIRGRGLELEGNRLRPDKTTANDVYANAAVPPASEYVVGMTVRFIGVNSDNYAELYARGTPLSNGYAASITVTGAYSITRYVGGVATVLASGNMGTLPTFTDISFVFFVTDTAKRLIVNGTIVATTADNTVTAAGVVGLGLSNKTQDDAIADNFFASTLAPTAVTMDAMHAVRDRGRVLLTWTTGREADNLGYRIWRDEGMQRVLLTPSPIAGSAFFVNARALENGSAYRWIDSKPSRRATYWIEEIDLQGRREWHGPIEPAAGAIDDRLAPAPTLGQLAQTSGVAATEEPLAHQTSDAGGTNFELAGRAALKIFVTAPGVQEVAVPAGADPRRIQVWENGREIPVLIANDAVRFYGTPLDTPWSGTRVYWMTWNGDGRAARIDGKPAPNLPLHAAGGFAATVERREKLIFAATLESEDGDGFFGPLITTTPARQVLRAEHVDFTAPAAELTVTIQGATATQHRVAVTLNGHAAGVVELAGQEKRRAALRVQSAWLRDGDNEIALVSQNGFDDVSAVEAVRLTYSRKYHASGGTLVFTAPGRSRVPVAGFAGDVLALDITEAHAPQLLEVQGGVVSVRSHGTRTVIATERTHRPAVETNEPSALHAAKGDVVMIAPRAFLPALAPLAARRGAAILAAVEDVYDEFSFGAKDPNAIRAFIGAVRPRAVLLAGDGSYDARNYVGGGAADVIPVRLVATALQRVPSDAWYSDFNGDGVADVAIGRLPARSAAELQTMVAKIVAYETAALPSRDVLFVNGAGFSHRPAAATASISIDGEGAAAARQNLLQQWAQGPGFVNFIGHGSVEIWQSASFFSRGDAAALTNARLPLVAAMTCLNGYFHDVRQESLAEALLRNANGGAAGVWALSTLTDPTGQIVADDALLSALLGGATLGEATIAAQRATTDPDVRRTLLLFGDPAMRMR